MIKNLFIVLFLLVASSSNATIYQSSFLFYSRWPSYFILLQESLGLVIFWDSNNHARFIVLPEFHLASIFFPAHALYGSIDGFMHYLPISEEIQEDKAPSELRDLINSAYQWIQSYNYSLNSAYYLNSGTLSPLKR